MNFVYEVKFYFTANFELKNKEITVNSHQNQMIFVTGRTLGLGGSILFFEVRNFFSLYCRILS
jgi:hypothetical protein